MRLAMRYPGTYLNSEGNLEYRIKFKKAFVQARDDLYKKFKHVPGFSVADSVLRGYRTDEEALCKAGTPTTRETIRMLEVEADKALKASRNASAKITRSLIDLQSDKYDGRSHKFTNAMKLELEQELRKHAHESTFGPTMVCAFSARIIKKYAHDLDEPWTPNPDWGRDFLHKHMTKTPRRPTTKVASSAAIGRMEELRVKLIECLTLDTLTGVVPALIVSSDETGISFMPGQTLAWADLGAKHVEGKSLSASFFRITATVSAIQGTATTRRSSTPPR